MDAMRPYLELCRQRMVYAMERSFAQWNGSLAWQKDGRTPITQRLIPNIPHQLLNFRSLVGRQRQQGETRWTAIVSVQVKGVLQCRNTKLTGHARRRLHNALLLELSKFLIAVFECGFDLEARGGSR